MLPITHKSVRQLPNQRHIFKKMADEIVEVPQKYSPMYFSLLFLVIFFKVTEKSTVYCVLMS